MKKLYLLAAAALTLAACTDEAYLGENKELTKTDNPIGFNMSTPAMSRAEHVGADAAGILNNQFYVYGIKNETGNVGTITANNVNNVMNNYVVTYADGSAFSTTSNTEGWEYVGNTLSDEEIENVTPNAEDAVQTIKYWDWGATDYTFTAISALPSDVTNGYVKIAKINIAKKTVEGEEVDATVYDQGYEVTISDDATFSNIYLSNRKNIARADYATRTTDNQYGGNVTFTFGSLGAQVRVGMYETIPGYKVTIDKLYNGESTPAPVTDKFVAACPNTVVAEGKTITAKVTYYSNTEANPNMPKVEITGETSVQPTLTLGTKIKKDTELSTVATAPTYDQDGGLYTPQFPQANPGSGMTVTVDYTLTCEATGEQIHVTEAKAIVPKEYVAWKANYAYTYLFKISDNTNGHTDPSVGPAGLYPITFDAVVVDAGNGIAEYITTVSDPSITTFGVKDGKYVADASAYKAGTDVYATVGTGTALTVGDEYTANINLYTVTASSTSKYEAITEAEVAEALAETSTGNWLTVTKKDLTAEANIVATVPTEDGKTVSINALKIPGVEKGTYAVEYVGTKAIKATYEKVYSGEVPDDADVDPDMTYYIVSGSGETAVYTKVDTPAKADLGSYYKEKTAKVPASGKQYKVFTVTE